MMCDKLESITRRYVNHANTRKEYSIILFCLLLFLCLPVLPLAAEPVTLTDDTDVIHLGTHIYILEDPAGSLAAADVMSPGSIGKFKKKQGTESQFWLYPVGVLGTGPVCITLYGPEEMASRAELSLDGFH